MHLFRRAVLVLAITFTFHSVIVAQSISLIFPTALLDTSITAITIKDVQHLLGQACGCEVSLNNTNADVLLKLPEIKKEEAVQLNRFAREAKFPYRNYPEHNYDWSLKKENSKIILELKATSWQGVSFGLYGLLQEKLGFKFYHPRRMIVPHWKEFPLQQPFVWDAKALFDKNGFHLHTEHPIELTEQLHDGNIPHALDDVKEYINWLVRNGQDYFEFCLLESINRKEWPAHAKAIVDYCHQRGIMAAADLSLHMIQQKTFQLYVGPVAKKKQVEKNLKWLTQADWDFFNMEFSTAEFISGNKKKKEELRLFVISWLKEHSNTKLMGRQHVVKHENEAGHKRKNFEWDSTTYALDKERGVLSHTVMFYSMTEPNAPVYENKNQRHMFQFLLDQMKVRETWYYPESAYWITFDNSIPMMLLPYLSSRLSDIDTCVAYKVPGHVTFSSGWEWGYWLFDWSIARWSWQHTTDGIAEKRFPEMYAYDITTREGSVWWKEIFSKQLASQQHYLKDSSLMQWMTAMSITDEISIKALSNAYHPRPQWSYKYLERKANLALIEKTRREAVDPLNRFALQVKSNSGEYEYKSLRRDSIQDEWYDGIQITGMRAAHRANVLGYILCRREAALNKQKCDCDSLLRRAVTIRNEAQQIVEKRQKSYRYPLESIVAKRWDHTAYHFGYLYTASDLHYWYREEEEARRNKYNATFMNIMNMFRIAGIIN